MRKLALAVLLALLPPSAAALPSPSLAQTQAYAISTAELMRVTALDEIFTHFGAAIEIAPHEQAVPFNASMRGVWAEATREVFGADSMHKALARALDDKFGPDDYKVYADFFASPFGRRITSVERAATLLSPEVQLAARGEGEGLAATATPRRLAQVDEMLRLVSADISIEMVKQSIRGMLIGMSVTRQQGDISVPWEEIDAQLALLMPGVEADIGATQRAMMFYAYRDFTEADLDTYLAFLRTDAAQRFYAVAAYSVGEIVRERMLAFGEALVTKMGRVNI
jgi:hypothetical protein